PVRSHAWTPPSAGCPVPPLPGGLDTVASRHGSRPMGKKMLGAVSVSFFVAGALMFGSSPRWRTKIRFGLSANTLWPAPNVQPSWPDSVDRSFGQSATLSYGPYM